jgi:hypothetical protein
MKKWLDASADFAVPVQSIEESLALWVAELLTTESLKQMIERLELELGQ